MNNYSFTSIFRFMAVIGDSLSSGEFEIPNPNDSSSMSYIDKIPYSWAQFLARKNDLTMYNFTRGGMTAKEYINSFAQDHDFFNKKYQSQAYIIALGVNDLLARHFPMGNLDDIDTINYLNNKDSFIGDYARIILKYKNISPEAKFFLVNMPQEESDNKEHIQIKKDFNNLLYSLVKILKNCYVIDLYNKMPIYTNESKKLYYLNGHLSPMGYVYTAEIIDNLIDEIIRNNPDDFKYIGLSDLIKTGL